LFRLGPDFGILGAWKGPHRRKKAVVKRNTGNSKCSWERHGPPRFDFAAVQGLACTQSGIISVLARKAGGSGLGGRQKSSETSGRPCREMSLEVVTAVNRIRGLALGLHRSHLQRPRGTCRRGSLDVVFDKGFAERDGC
jgi:hypothetical protein